MQVDQPWPALLDTVYRSVRIRRGGPGLADEHHQVAFEARVSASTNTGRVWGAVVVEPICGNALESWQRRLVGSAANRGIGLGRPRPSFIRSSPGCSTLNRAAFALELH